MNASSERVIRYVANHVNLPIPSQLHWLSEAEQNEMAAWHNDRRREQWLAGRWIAKRLICLSTLPEELRRVEVLSRTAEGLGTRPRVFIDGRPIDQRLSISHAAQSVLVGLGALGCKIGVDVALDVPSSERFRNAWFSRREKVWLEVCPRERAPILWGLKEAIFKAYAEGQAWNPRTVEVLAVEHSLVYSELDGQKVDPLTTWIRSAAGGAATVVWEHPQGRRFSPERKAEAHEVISCL